MPAVCGTFIPLHFSFMCRSLSTHPWLCFSFMWEDLPVVYFGYYHIHFFPCSPCGGTLQGIDDRSWWQRKIKGQLRKSNFSKTFFGTFLFIPMSQETDNSYMLDIECDGFQDAFIWFTCYFHNKCFSLRYCSSQFWFISELCFW